MVEQDPENENSCSSESQEWGAKAGVQGGHKQMEVCADILAIINLPLKNPVVLGPGL